MELIDFKKAKAERETERLLESLPSAEQGGNVVKSKRDVEIVQGRLRKGEHAFNEDLSSIFYDVCLAQEAVHAWAKDLRARHKIGAELIAAVHAELEGSCEPRLDHQKIAIAGRKTGLFQDIFDAAIRGEPWAIGLLWHSGFSYERAIHICEWDWLKFKESN